MGFPVGIGIPWVSYGNGIKTPTWEWEWGGVGMKVDGNGNDPYFHGKFPTDFLLLWTFIRLQARPVLYMLILNRQNCSQFI